ncbi:hypothetical protein C8J56DRAFT_907851 [Mycena floridula]|nr:hypothetical protein C8J56DRAFT_907851 [Mycena floridula]
MYSQLMAQPTMPAPDDQSEIDEMAGENSEASGSLVTLYNVTRFLVVLPQMFIFAHFILITLSFRISFYLKQWVLLWILAWRYPALRMEGVLTLCKMDSWLVGLTGQDTEKEMLRGAATGAAKALISPWSWFFIFNAALYSQEISSPIMSGAFQLLLFPLKVMACSAVFNAALDSRSILYISIVSFGQYFEKQLENARRMEDIRIIENARRLREVKMSMASSVGENVFEFDSKNSKQA